MGISQPEDLDSSGTAVINVIQAAHIGIIICRAVRQRLTRLTAADQTGGVPLLFPNQKQSSLGCATNRKGQVQRLRHPL